MLIDGKKEAEKLLEDLKIRYDKLKEKYRKAGLAVVLVGDNKASKVYVNIKQKTCERLDILTKNIYLKEDISEKELIDTLLSLNEDKSIDGILVQLPLPKHLSRIDIANYINPKKDVDGFTPYNMGKLILNKDGIRPCTPSGVIHLIKSIGVEIEGKDVVIIGRSNMVGKPLTNMLLNLSATVQICHSKTKDIDDKIAKADILVTAVGLPGLINKNHKFKKGVVIIDVGTTKVENKLLGDVDKIIYENENVSYITPVPGGVGPMTVAYLMKNTIDAYEKEVKK